MRVDDKHLAWLIDHPMETTGGGTENNLALDLRDLRAAAREVVGTWKKPAGFLMAAQWCDEVMNPVMDKLIAQLAQAREEEGR